MARNSSNKQGGSSGQPKAGRKLRNLIVVGGLVSLSSVGAVFVANAAVSAPAPGRNLTICHRTDSNTNPYVIESPNINATGLAGGHDTHTGPIWNPTLKASHIKWGDIIPPFTYQPKTGPAVHFPGLNWSAEGQQILANGCGIPNTVVPANPTVTQSVCNADHVATVPEVVFATTAGITYSIAPAPAAGGTSIVTATATAPANWFMPPAPTGWTYVNLTHETFTIHFDAAPTDCTTSVVPANPTVTESACVGDPGAPTTPTLELATTTGITYTTDKNAPYSGGETVVVTATASGAGDVFVAPAPTGWVFVNSHTETYTFTFAAVPSCTGSASGVNPVSPTVTNSVCAGTPSQPTADTLTLATVPAGVTYTASANAPYTGGEAVTVTAVSDATHVFSAPAPTGWTFVNAHRETFALTFDATPTCSGSLANTGVKTQELIAIGGILLVFGAGLQFLGMGMRRRNEI